jgi:diaminopimelate decarboxylase
MIASEALVAAAAAHGTPLYVYDLDQIADRVATLRARLPGRARLAYAVKANPSAAVLRRMAQLGLGADIASGGELAACLDAGIAADRIVFTGPGKRDEELAAAVAHQVGAVTVESLGELERLRRLARDAPTPIGVLVRAAGASRDGNLIGAGDGRFGMRWVDLVEAARIAAAVPELELLGLHRFDASNLRCADELLEHARATVGLAGRLAAQLGLPLRLVDVGGGLGIRYHDDEPELDLAAFGRGLSEVRDEMDADPRLAGAELLLEPGRFLVGPCGAYLVRVLDTKQTDAGPVATVDGGIHHLLRPTLVGSPHRVRLLSPDADERPRRAVTVGGPLCTSLDVLARGEILPELRVGDLLAVLDAGAYGFTESMPLFLSHPVPPEVVLSGGGLAVA